MSEIADSSLGWPCTTSAFRIRRSERLRTVVTPAHTKLYVFEKGHAVMMMVAELTIRRVWSTKSWRLQQESDWKAWGAVPLKSRWCRPSEALSVMEVGLSEAMKARCTGQVTRHSVRIASGKEYIKEPKSTPSWSRLTGTDHIITHNLVLVVITHIWTSTDHWSPAKVTRVNTV